MPARISCRGADRLRLVEVSDLPAARDGELTLVPPKFLAGGHQRNHAPGFRHNLSYGLESVPFLPITCPWMPDPTGAVQPCDGHPREASSPRRSGPASASTLIVPVAVRYVAENSGRCAYGSHLFLTAILHGNVARCFEDGRLQRVHQFCNRTDQRFDRCAFA